MNEFLPLNDLEFGLLAAKRREISISEFVRKFVSSDLALPTAEEVKEDGTGFAPILFDKQGTKMLAVFTDKVRASRLEHIAKYCLVMSGLNVLRRVPPGYGLVINPGLEVGFEISADGIVEIVRDLS